MANHAPHIASRPATLDRPSYSRLLAVAVAVASLAIAFAGSSAHAATSPVVCDKVASPEGSDSASGTATSPLRTAQALINALSPGQVGCLRAGTYSGGLRFNHGGGAGSPIVLRSYPGEQALITGRIYVPRGSNDVTVADLHLDGNFQPNGETLPSPTVNANDVTFESDDVTDDHTGVCFLIGSPTYGEATSTVITGNRIHDCGIMPARNYNHAIYVEAATNTRIVDNLIDHNSDRGIQLYPDAQHTLVEDNVISHNGEGVIFSGGEGLTSSNNTVQHNLIVYSLVRHDIESWYPEGNPVGVGNVALDNCVYGAAEGPNIENGRGFTAAGNVTASSGDLVVSGNGYFVTAGSPCAGVVPDLVSGAVTPPTPSPEPGPSGSSPTESSTGTGSGSGSGSTPTESPKPTETGNGPPSGGAHSSPPPTPTPVTPPPHHRHYYYYARHSMLSHRATARVARTATHRRHSHRTRAHQR